MKTISHNPELNILHSFSKGSLQWFLCLMGACVLFLSPLTLVHGQERTINELKIEFVELENVSKQVVLANMQTRAGAVFDEGVIDQDIRSLYRTNLFEYIEVRRNFVSDTEVDLTFSIRPKYRVGQILFTGNDRISDRRLRREIQSSPGRALDERQARLDAQKIFELYQQRRYPEVQVDFEIEKDPSRGIGNIVFEIDEGPRVRVSRIDFEGTEHFSDRQLRRVMQTKRWHPLAFLTGAGRFKDDDFEDDLMRLRMFHREAGFLDVELDEEEVDFDFPRLSRLHITIPIKEGRRYQVGEVRITGNERFSTEELMETLSLHPGDYFQPSEMSADRERLYDYYGQFGYLDTMVRPNRIPNVETGNIDIHYEIREADKVHVESVVIEGNTKTKSKVIIRELGLRPGDVFDTTRMKASERRLQNTRFFEEVSVRPEATGVEGRRDLAINVREARTGNLTFGLGFSSLERAVIFGEVTQSNFDLFNPRGGFQGAGQKMRIRLELGTRSNQAVIAFEEPWLFDRQLAFGFQLYRQESDFFTSSFRELRTGAEVYLRKRLIELIEGRLSYTFEVVEISDTDASTPATIRAEEGSRTVSKTQFTLLRDTRDSLLIPTRGNRFELISTLAGGPLGADTNYYSFEARGAQFWPVTEAGNSVLSVIARTGVIDNFGSSDSVPFFDRFFLGGPRTMRGFQFREVGPKEDGDPIGGSTYGYFSAEYSFEIVEPLRFAVFYDAGFVNQDFADFNTSNFNDNYGFGLRIFVMGAPIMLDYGIPITTDEENDTGGQFHFSFGTRF
ncbi:MAG: outer membrane protein assembly factor BamA [Opitutales bacterium]|nr:outer membrane protein assembly factor BamA [Opitutales bacterium]